MNRLQQQLQDAVELHNQGAHCLLSNRPLDAIRLLRRSMHILKAVHHDVVCHSVDRVNSTAAGTVSAASASTVSRDTDHRNDSDEDDHVALMDTTSSSTEATAATTPPGASFATASTDWSNVTIDDDTSAAACAEPKLHNDLYFIYRRPILLPTEFGFVGAIVNHVDEDHLLDDLLQTLSMYAIFNLALACHVLGIVSATDAPLKRAMVLYKALANIPLHANAPLAATSSSWCNTAANAVVVMEWPLFHCLVLNNLAYIHFDNCDYDESQYCAERLFVLAEDTGCLDYSVAQDDRGGGDDAMYSIQPASSPSSSTTTYRLSDDEIGEIKINTLLLQRPVVARAA